MNNPEDGPLSVRQIQEVVNWIAVNEIDNEERIKLLRILKRDDKGVSKSWLERLPNSNKKTIGYLGIWATWLIAIAICAVALILLATNVVPIGTLLSIMVPLVIVSILSAVGISSLIGGYFDSKFKVYL